MRMLILGSTGMLGTAFKKLFSDKKIEFSAIDHDQLKIESPESVAEVFENNPADVALNCVAVVGINPCEKNPVMCTNINALGALYVSRQAARRGMTMVQFSSHAVFNGYKNDYYTEEDTPIPTSVYATNKYDSEVYASMCEKHYVVRAPTMFGPRNNTAMGFVDKMLALLEQGRELKVADDKYDTPTYAVDVASQVLDILIQNKPFGLYHVANAGKVSYYDFIITLRNMMGLDNVVHRAKDADFPGLAHKPLRTAMRSSKLPALRSWQEALQAYLLDSGRITKDKP